MTFEEALAGLTGNQDIEPVYAYASDPDRGWLVRLTKASNGKPSAVYGTGTSLFEGGECWFKIYKITKRIRDLEWGYLRPREWWRIDNLGFVPDKECRDCVHWQLKGSSYCWERCQYTSPIMCCPQYSKRINVR